MEGIGKERAGQVKNRMKYNKRDMVGAQEDRQSLIEVDESSESRKEDSDESAVEGVSSENSSGQRMNSLLDKMGDSMNFNVLNRQKKRGDKNKTKEVIRTAAKVVVEDVESEEENEYENSKTSEEKISGSNERSKNKGTKRGSRSEYNWMDSVEANTTSDMIPMNVVEGFIDEEISLRLERVRAMGECSLRAIAGNDQRRMENLANRYDVSDMYHYRDEGVIVGDAILRGYRAVILRRGEEAATGGGTSIQVVNNRTGIGQTRWFLHHGTHFDVLHPISRGRQVAEGERIVRIPRGRVTVSSTGLDGATMPRGMARMVAEAIGPRIGIERIRGREINACDDEVRLYDTFTRNPARVGTVSDII
jgi:hypothetical protein